MTRGARHLLFAFGGTLVAVLFVWGVLGMPKFGSTDHPYRDRSVHAAAQHETANVVAAVNFDQRGFDTLGEESIFLASVIGAAALLRPTKEEREQQKSGGGGVGDVMASTRFAGYVLLPLTLLVGFDVVAHGHVTPGGGFQGGVVLATGFHVIYVAGRYEALEKVRPVTLFENGEVLGALAFAGLGFAGIAISGSFLSNVIPFGSFGGFLSAGTVEVLNFAVGVEVACGVIVLLAHFFEQAIKLRDGSRAES
ncbi:MAG TPA: MnhB domain-containing protein [Acidothermaceae bacterium]|nr:MnhB domain-containing protein [Acidothermaceae bacterium]